MTEKEDLLEQAGAKGIDVSDDPTIPELKERIAAHDASAPAADGPPAAAEDEDGEPDIPEGAVTGVQPMTEEEVPEGGR